MVNIQPRNDRVLVQRLAEPERIGSIIVPDVARQKGILGKVIAVGPKCEVKPGQLCYFNSRWNDVEPLPDGMHLVQEADIFCIVAKNARPAIAKSPDLPPLVQRLNA